MTYHSLAFFDLDGTLLDHESQITPEIKTAMAQLVQNGTLPIIATGRTEIEITDIKEAAGINSNIVMNGAFIRLDGQKVYEEIIDPQLCEQFLNVAHSQGQEVSFYNEQAIWASGKTPDLPKAYALIHSEVPEIHPTKHLTEKVNMLLVLGQDGDARYLDAFPELTFYRNGKYSIDTVLNGTSKGAAVRRLLEMPEFKGLTTYGFGDGSNDFALLEACDHKIAMGNALPALKEMATFVTKKNTEGGIVHALKHFELI